MEGGRLDVKINKPRLFITQFSGGNTAHTHTHPLHAQKHTGGILIMNNVKLFLIKVLRFENVFNNLNHIFQDHPVHSHVKHTLPYRQ